MSIAAIRAVLETVMDPEIPVISVVDLGIVRGIEEDRVIITPTYSGCPATDVIERSIREALDASGFRDIAIETMPGSARTEMTFKPWVVRNSERRLRTCSTVKFALP